MNDIEKAAAALQWLVDATGQLEQEAKRLRLEIESLHEKRSKVVESLRQHLAQVQTAREDLTKAALAGRDVATGYRGPNPSEVYL